ncbi:unnamed protein product (macronuclear) [Paramecium tetraurelia]|uniref:Uncharacterized protein n=1 Tax=Paramecium tetraurelia TaxID=5888 RepID=A0E262_PARTE|nr:uncharacterized protein GSPATT00022551001 [Paramecium tetraurelia]CAK89379.1 unnamed protein product [Paramecium tetraurelia]|eukprot:XP_001456776.1 hypothetical protein (macronuclear) [Paramecium tetraurelia strain d4-2]
MKQTEYCLLMLRPYKKVPTDKKKQLVELVFQKDWKIKQASTHLGINYATAKNIIFRFRKTNIQKQPYKLPESKRCQYKLIGSSNSKIKLVCSQGGVLNCDLISKNP